MAQPFPSHQLLIGSLAVEVTVKPIKHLHLSVLPPHGAVRISAPERMSEAQVRAYTIGKLGWIRRQQSRFERQERETPRQVIERESLTIWGHGCCFTFRKSMPRQKSNCIRTTSSSSSAPPHPA